MTNPIDNIRTLLVDDHAVVRQGYRSYLEQQPGFEVVAEAATADEAYAQYKRVLPDVVIMDIMLQGASGIDASRRILAMHPGAKILIFSMYSEPVFIQQALDIGVLGVVGKDSPPEILCEAAIAVAQGRRYLVGDVAQNLVFSRYNQSKKLFESLSQREFEIFQMLVSGSTVDQIADALNLSAKTIANRLSAIRQKLDVHSDIQLVRLAASFGMIPWMRATPPIRNPN